MPSNDAAQHSAGRSPGHLSAVTVTCWLLMACHSAPERSDPPIPPAPQELVGDYARLQGTWIVTYNELKRVPERGMEGALFIFEKDRFRLGTDAGSERFAIDETALPKRIDFDNGHSPAIRGIYDLNGDQLTICSTGPGDARPTEFKTSAFSTAVLTHLRRQ